MTSEITNTALILGQNQGWNLEGSYGRAFAKIGWQTEFWDPQQALNNEVRGAQLGKRFASFVNVEPWLRKANLSLLRIVEQLRPTAIFVIATEGVRAGTLAQIKVLLPHAPLVCIYPDSPHNLSVERISCLPVFDLVTASSPAWVESLKTLGGLNVRYLPFAADVDLHQRVSGATNHSNGHDVAFIGNWRREREEFLEQLVDFDIWVWGEKWWKDRTREGSPLRSRWGGRRVVGSDFAMTCAAHRILLNLLDTPTWPGPNMRTFEQPACGGFSLATRTSAVLELFEEGKNIECFESVEEARDKINFYLKNDDARERIAEASHRFVVDEGHTYTDRARQLVSWALA